MMQIKLLLPLSPLLLLMSACQSQLREPSFGEKIKAESADRSRIGESWVKGEKLIVDGNKLVQKGENDLKKAKKLEAKATDNVRKGKAMTKKGYEMRDAAEKAYQETTGRPTNTLYEKPKSQEIK